MKYTKSMNNTKNKTTEITLKELNEKLTSITDNIATLYKELKDNTDFNESYNMIDNQLLDYFNSLSKFSCQGAPAEENYAGRDNKVALKNEKCKEQCREEIEKVLSFLDTNQTFLEIKKITNLMWRAKKLIKDTLPYKIYVLSSFNSVLPYPVKDFEQDKYTLENFKTINWKYIGFAESLEEAYHYIQNDTNHWFNPLTHTTAWHLCVEPDDEMYNSFVKIESEYFIEYFDNRAPRPIHQRYGFRKTESKCTFCNSLIEGTGHSCYPINIYHDWDFGYRRCCNKCHEELVLPAKKDHELATKLRFKYRFEMPTYESGK